MYKDVSFFITENARSQENWTKASFSRQDCCPQAIVMSTQDQQKNKSVSAPAWTGEGLESPYPS